MNQSTKLSRNTFKNAEITQVVYNISKMTYKMDIHIDGCNISINITHNEAATLIDTLLFKSEVGTKEIFYL
jgi:hypothetical protein